MIHCDNKQTIDLINKTASLISTKLHHVDIYQHWLHKYVQNKIFIVKKLSINQILANSLTKSLSHQKHENFLQLLRMLNLSFHWIFWWFYASKWPFFRLKFNQKKQLFEFKNACFLHFKKTILHLKETLLQLKKTLF